MDILYHRDWQKEIVLVLVKLLQLIFVYTPSKGEGGRPILCYKLVRALSTKAFVAIMKPCCGLLTGC